MTPSPRSPALLCLFFLLAAPPAAADDTWTFQLFGGAPYNFTLPLKIRQSGQPDLRFDARYRSEPFTSPFYYAARIARWKGDRAWELEFVHDKLFLENTPPEVQGFSISHGYNILTVNRAWKGWGFVYRLGLGLVITHPENTVRGKTLSENRGIFSWGYHLSGPAAQVSAEKRLPLWKGLFAAAEGKLSASYVRIPVEDGHADVPNVSVHGLLGLGYDY